MGFAGVARGMKVYSSSRHVRCNASLAVPVPHAAPAPDEILCLVARSLVGLKTGPKFRAVCAVTDVTDEIVGLVIA